VTVDGLKVTAAGTGDLSTVKVALRLNPAGNVPVMVTVVWLATWTVLTVKFAVSWPAGTVTLAGTVATAVLLLESATLAPPAGAGSVMVTVPVEGVLPSMVVGFSVSDCSVFVRLTVSTALRVVLWKDAEIVTLVSAV
jgi:hypothetical protein